MNTSIVHILKLFRKYLFSIVFVALILILTTSQNYFCQSSDWFEKESTHFKLIYRNSHSYLADHILNSAEKSLSTLSKIFDFTPSERIIINTYDVYDYGFGSATSVPNNYIRLEIEPFEPGYENIPYYDRFQWVLNHELVHIVVNDQATKYESFFRSLFSKVAPEQIQPMTILYSILTNFSRYTPHWHQEAIAVFLETWLSGGYGRVLGNFDEMYFRSLVMDGAKFPFPNELDAKKSHTSFLLQKLFYIYGERFTAFLSINYGTEKLIDWFKIKPSDFYVNFESKFKNVFNIDFDLAWQNFIDYEKEFQIQNINKLESVPLTQVKRLTKKPMGWITQPYYNRRSNEMIFGYHKPHHLSTLQSFDLNNNISKDIETLPTPSMHQVSSIAFDNSTGLVFFTTNNNMLYRDIWKYNTETNEKELLFENVRTGALTVSERTHELWGIQHYSGKAALVYSGYPYISLQTITDFNVGEEVTQLSVSPSGRYLAAVLHRPDGNQKLILADCSDIKETRKFRFRVLYSQGSPENPSWSPDENSIYWNAFTNGVSNIYKLDLKSFNSNPVTNTIRGLFRPVYLSKDSLFAFEFTSEGFIPVKVGNDKAKLLPAINYMGERVIEKNPDLRNDFIDLTYGGYNSSDFSKKENYSGLSNLSLQTLVPVVSGFQSEVVLGLYSRISDPLIRHDLTIELGYSPFHNNRPFIPKFHLKIKYEYKKKYEFRVDYNAQDFYDLFNTRKRGMIGTKVSFAHTHFWLYDNPHKIKQKSEIAFYTGVEFINDNLVAVSEPDFTVIQTVINSKNLRRSIGSSDYEKGDMFNLTLRGFGNDPRNPAFAGQIYGEWDRYTTWSVPHNVFHYQLAAGYHYDNTEIIQARFYFGGFGNRIIENAPVKQFRKVLRFPGIPIYSMDATAFGKILIENNFPPIRFANASISQHYLNHIDISIYSQALIVKSDLGSKWIDLGAQINFVFKHWFNLESTLSAGIANAWYENGNNLEWFISYKLLKN